MKRRIGSRYEVYHGKAQHTSGGLTKSQLLKNKKGVIVSKKASGVASRKNNLGSYLQSRGRRSKRGKKSGTKDFDKLYSDPPKARGRKRKRKN